MRAHSLQNAIFYAIFVKKAVIFHIFFEKVLKNLFIFHKICAIIKPYQATTFTVQKGGSLYEDYHQWKANDRSTLP